MTELILVRSSPGPAFVTDFWNRTLYHWPSDILATDIDGLRVASANAIQRYRADYDCIHGFVGRPPIGRIAGTDADGRY